MHVRVGEIIVIYEHQIAFYDSFEKCLHRPLGLSRAQAAADEKIVLGGFASKREFYQRKLAQPRQRAHQRPTFRCPADP